MSDEEIAKAEVEGQLISALASNLCQPWLNDAMVKKRYVSAEETAMMATNAVRIAKAIVVAQRELL